MIYFVGQQAYEQIYSEALYKQMEELLVKSYHERYQACVCSSCREDRGENFLLRNIPEIRYNTSHLVTCKCLEYHTVLIAFEEEVYVGKLYMFILVQS